MQRFATAVGGYWGYKTTPTGAGPHASHPPGGPPHGHTLCPPTAPQHPQAAVGHGGGACGTPEATVRLGWVWLAPGVGYPLATDRSGPRGHLGSSRHSLCDPLFSAVLAISNWRGSPMEVLRTCLARRENFRAPQFCSRVNSSYPTDLLCASTHWVRDLPSAQSNVATDTPQQLPWPRGVAGLRCGAEEC